MTDPEFGPRGDETRTSPAGWVWWLPFVALAIWAAERLGAFSLWGTVTIDGVSRRVPNGYVTVDHPFHTSRAEVLVRALRDGELVRWIGSHQGGYPAEFYPLGAAALDVLGWLLALGTQPMSVVHKLVVIAIFLAPAIGFALFCRADRALPVAAIVAFAAHLVVRGDWWSGGSQELVEWGLVSNVTAATVLLIAMALFLNADGRWTWRWVGLAGATAGFALLTNPRTALVLGPFAGAVLVTALLDAGMPGLRTWLRRLVVMALMAGALAAPVIFALVRFRNLYSFVHYTGYENLAAYVNASIQAVGGPLFWCGLAGIVAGLSGIAGRAMRIASLTLVFYVLLTAGFILEWVPQSLVSQLELTRLMPMQRLLWMLMAGVAIALPLTVASKRTSVSAWWSWGYGSAIAVTLMFLYVLTPPSFVPDGDRGLRSPVAGAQAGLVDLEAAVRIADNTAPTGTTVLVLGTLEAQWQWHDQLWAPSWSDRRFLYNDWLWLWQQRQRRADAEDPAIGNAYRDPALALDAGFLAAHGVGVVVATGKAAVAAATAPHLELVRSGTWSVYRVRDAAGVARSAGATLTVERFDDRSIVIRGTSAGEPVVVHHNWFPRWTARVNGDSVPVLQTADGQMQFAVPAGEVLIELTYGTDLADWLARLVALAGLAALLVLMVRPARTGISD